MVKVHTVSCLLVTLVLALVSGPVHAQESQCGVKRGKASAALDELTWKRLNDVFEDVGEELYDSAYEKLQNLIGRARDKYTQAVIYQALAQVEWSRSNFDAALSHFEKAVELDALPDQTHFGLMYQIAQLYYMQDRYDDALDKLALWMCKVPEEKITHHAWVLKASILARKKDWRNVVPAIDTAIGMSDDPEESWYQLKLAAHFELEQFPRAAETLEVMIQSWPEKKLYWVQLSQIYYKLKMDDEALSILALAYRRNMLDTKSDILFLSNLYSNGDIPFKAAQTLQKGIEDGIVNDDERHWTMVADAWFAAEEKDKALNAYERAGASAANGEIDLRRAYILVDMERWADAAAALEAALSKGGIDERKTGEAYVLQGMSQFNLGNYEKASTAWGRATRYPKSRASAEQWLNHMREERARKTS